LVATYLFNFVRLVALPSYFYIATTSFKSFFTEDLGASEANFSYEVRYNFAHTWYVEMVMNVGGSATAKVLMVVQKALGLAN
jgi:hypothetical protein